jgi:hypothetical protein
MTEFITKGTSNSIGGGYIGPEEMIFHKTEDGIFSGGFSVNSIMMKAGLSPIMTVNRLSGQNGGGEKVSDLFQDLVVPNWTLSYTCYGQARNDQDEVVDEGFDEEEEQDEDDDEVHERKNNSEEASPVIEDDLHDKLLELVMVHNSNLQRAKRRATRKAVKSKASKKLTRKSKAK